MLAEVRLISVTNNCQTVSVAGARGCRDQKSSAEILDELMKLSKDDRREKERKVLANSLKKGHGSVGDQSCFIFSIENLPRIATLFLCAPEYLSHLQQSLRIATADKGFYLPGGFSRTPEDYVLRSAFELYREMLEAGIPGEDARFILPLYANTNIQTAGDARELCHLLMMSKDPGVPPVVREIIEEMIRLAKDVAPELFEQFDQERLSLRPSPMLFAESNCVMDKLAELVRGTSSSLGSFYGKSGLEIFLDASFAESVLQKRDEAMLSVLKHIHFDFVFPASLAAFHQITRQRTWNLSVESIYSAVHDKVTDRRIVVPPSIAGSRFADKYRSVCAQMLEFSALTPKDKMIGFAPHALSVHVLAHIDGWNALQSIGKRTCMQAQWEIRNIAVKMARFIRAELPYLSKYIGPQCKVYGYCPEGKNCSSKPTL